MRSRGLVVAIAIVLAVVAAAAVILYTNQVRQDAFGDESGDVVVATQDITPGTQLDGLIAQGVFETIKVPNDARVQGAVTTLTQLRGQTATAPILAREQIPTSRLSSGTATISFVGVSEGNVGLALTLGGPQAGAGTVQIGDSVAVFVTFNADTIVLRDDLKSIFSPRQFADFVAAAQGGNTGNIAKLPAFRVGAAFTMTLVPSAKVLKIGNPVADENGRTRGGDITLMLDLPPEDAEAVVFSMETASVWLGLLPPPNAEEGLPTEAVLGPKLEKMLGIAG